MAEYFDDSSLYDILHNTLEICNDEIGCLGFALYDEYVDEQIAVSYTHLTLPTIYSV